jgi:hypothetical protein
MERLIEVQRDRLEKSRSKLPPLPTNHDTTEPDMAADLQERFRTIAKELEELEISWSGTMSLMARVDTWFNGPETAPEKTDCESEGRAGADGGDDDDLNIRSGIDWETSENYLGE